MVQSKHNPQLKADGKQQQEDQSDLYHTRNIKLPKYRCHCLRNVVGMDDLSHSTVGDWDAISDQKKILCLPYSKTLQLINMANLLMFFICLTNPPHEHKLR